MLLSDALDVLKVRLECVDGLTVTTDPNAAVVVPMASITETQCDYNESFNRTNGAFNLEFEVTVYVSAADSASGHLERRAYLSGHGDYSVPLALMTQATGGDLLLNKVVVDTGEPGETDNYITAVFAGRAHVPGAVAT